MTKVVRKGPPQALDGWSGYSHWLATHKGVNYISDLGIAWYYEARPKLAPYEVSSHLEEVVAWMNLRGKTEYECES